VVVKKNRQDLQDYLLGNKYYLFFVFTQPDFTFWYTETPKRAENIELYILRIRVIGSSPCNPFTLFTA
jgi:hypothetical protein